MSLQKLSVDANENICTHLGTHLEDTPSSCCFEKEKLRYVFLGRAEMRQEGEAFDPVVWALGIFFLFCFTDTRCGRLA